MIEKESPACNRANCLRGGFLWLVNLLERLQKKK